ncbi:probable cytochrome P450 313a1 [Drosophila obscura]|uniref:probable cytochrome P450 313a1 n=1 Tax=Drosophila obscura TaxID=7282 RepID=UPI001BB1C7EE|nr:probable cytochrome P450 313a1 [Drosophila obscura]
MFSLQLWMAVGILAWMCLLWSRRRFYLLMLRLKGPIGYPFFGIAIKYIRDKRNIGMRSKHFKEYGPTYLTWIGPMPVVATSEPNVVQDILTSPHCMDKNQILSKAILMNGGPGSLGMGGAHWVERRKQMNPSFRHNVLMSFIPIFNEETKSFLSVLDTFVGQGEREIFPDLENCFFRASIRTTMGSDVKENPIVKNGTLIKHFQLVLDFTTLLMAIWSTLNRTISKKVGWETRRAEAAFAVKDPMRGIIEERLTKKPDEGQESLASRNIVINRAVNFLKSGEFSIEDAEAECSIIVAAGFVTTAITVFSTLTFMAMSPEYQDAAFEELKDVFPNAGDFEVSYEDLQKLVYLDRVLNESMRLIPAIPLLPRVTAQDVRLSNGILLPKGLTVSIDIFHTHRNKDVWGPEADKFNPDNFLPENISKIHQYAYIPFNKGKRYCIGWKYAEISAKIALAKVLRNFKLSTSFRPEDFVFMDNIGMELGKKPLLALQRRA